jgi:tryptophan-rich sensory protein
MEKDTWFTALPFVLSCIFVGFLSSAIGGAFKRQQWYDDTAKPALWPPQWVFPTVWIGNYTLMGMATWQVWRHRRKTNVIRPLAVFVAHLLHNFSFLPVVNYVKRKDVYVLMDSIGLFGGLVTTAEYAKVSQGSGLLMFPYVCWLLFTTFIKVLWWRLK